MRRSWRSGARSSLSSRYVSAAFLALRYKVHSNLHIGRQLLASLPHTLLCRVRGFEGCRWFRDLQGAFTARGREEAGEEAFGGPVHERKEQVVLPTSPRTSPRYYLTLGTVLTKYSASSDRFVHLCFVRHFQNPHVLYMSSHDACPCTPAIYMTTFFCRFVGIQHNHRYTICWTRYGKDKTTVSLDLCHD